MTTLLTTPNEPAPTLQDVELLGSGASPEAQPLLDETAPGVVMSQQIQQGNGWADMLAQITPQPIAT